MGAEIIVVGSVTYAMRSRDILAANGIPAYVERVARTPATGCGYGVYVADKTDQAELLLQNSGIRVLGRVPRQKGRHT